VHPSLRISKWMKRIIATVTNDLNYDQRMLRICSTLAVEGGYQVHLVGRVLPDSKPLREQPFSMLRLTCTFQKGPMFYLEYNLRLFVFLMLNPFDAVNIVDLDTMPAGVLAARLRKKKIVYDAHEYFTEVPEVTHRPVVKAIWQMVGRWGIGQCHAAYTVGPALAALLSELYKRPFATVRNVPRALKKQQTKFSLPHTEQAFILYQGALNLGRGLPEAIAAMKDISGLTLLLAGEGDLSGQLRQQVKSAKLEDRVIFLGKLEPDALQAYTAQAWLGLNLLEHLGQSYYYSLANKFFDYIQAGVPSLTVDFPEYRAIVTQHEVAILLSDIKPVTIANAIHSLQENEKAHRSLRQACENAAEEYQWEKERNVLLSTWSTVFTV
jgi:glycosyltransferase involved in cell wall biosynthesis